MYIIREYIAELLHKLKPLLTFFMEKRAALGKLSKWKKILFVALFSTLLVVVGMFFYLLAAPTGKSSESVTIEVPFGATLSKTVSDLEAANLVKNRQLFYVFVYVQGLGAKIKAGEYEFSPRLSQWRIAKMLARGITKTYLVTIPENWTVVQIAKRLAAQRLVSYDAFMALAQDPVFLAEIKIPAKSAEGFLYPETYRFDRTMGERRIMAVMAGRFWKVFTPQMEFRAKELGFSIVNVVTLASIIGKEATIAEEKPAIAAVFNNRLRLGMRLQSDPTAVYDFDEYRRKVTPQDLRKRSKYNTYMMAGLPRGPIANPAQDSLLAVLYPADVNYIYFVHARNGYHIFSDNYRDHVNSIRMLYKKKRARHSRTAR